MKQETTSTLQRKVRVALEHLLVNTFVAQQASAPEFGMQCMSLVVERAPLSMSVFRSQTTLTTLGPE